jgi:threonine aldolase
VSNMEFNRGFASDNNAGVHPEIMEAMIDCNRGHTVGYGDDPYTLKAVKAIREHFGEGTEAYFVFNGTAANVVGLRNLTLPFNSIICAETAHIEEDECGAPEYLTGCKLLPVVPRDGKIDPGSIRHHLKGFDFEHHSQPRVVSITQATEMGTVYSFEEIRQMADFVHSHGLLLHMDGARIANAAVSLGTSMSDITRAAGVDVLSFGGTKNGAMYGEAILFFTPGLSTYFKYYRKQSMQLASKMRYIAVQFEALLKNDLWKRNASHANEMAKLLRDRVMRIKGVQITRVVESNGVFAIVPPEIIPDLQKKFFFYVWDEASSEVRWMTSWDTEPEDIEQFGRLLEKLLS